MTLSDGVLAVERSLAQLEPAGGAENMRRDSRRNRRRLMAAANELMRDGRSDPTMQQVADLADIAVATAYRHFPSVEDLVYAYVAAVVDDMSVFATAVEDNGPQRITDMLLHWIELVRVHGHVMVNHRSPRGFLERLRDADPIIVRIANVWRDALADMLADEGVDPSAVPYALFLSNQLFDPRDVLDQLLIGDIEPDVLAHQLLSTLKGAIRGFIEASTPNPQAMTTT